MAAIFGFFVMGMALSIYKRPGMLIGIGLLAALYCWLGVPILPTLVHSTFYAYSPLLWRGRIGFYDRALSRHSVRLASHIKIKAEEQNKFSNNTGPSSKTEVY